MARVHNETVRVRAGVDAAKASAATLCSAGRLAEAKEARNEECSALTKLLGFETARGANHDVVLGFFSVIGLWRMRRVRRSNSLTPGSSVNRSRPLSSPSSVTVLPSADRCAGMSGSSSI